MRNGLFTIAVKCKLHRYTLGWIGEERALPLGIVGKVTAFNFPYAPFGWGALPALAAGNAVGLCTLNQVDP